MVEGTAALVDEATRLLTPLDPAVVRPLLFAYGWTEQDAAIPLRQWLQGKSPFSLRDIVQAARVLQPRREPLRGTGT